jgi:hypothetical protein
MTTMLTMSIYSIEKKKKNKKMDTHSINNLKTIYRYPFLAVAALLDESSRFFIRLVLKRII